MTRHFDDSTFLNSSWQFCWWPVFGMIKWPFQTLSDLQLRDKKGHGLNHLKIVVQKIPSSVFFLLFFSVPWFRNQNSPKKTGQIRQKMVTWVTFPLNENGHGLPVFVYLCIFTGPPIQLKHERPPVQIMDNFLQQKCLSRWWFQPFWKISAKMGIFPK